MLSKRKQSWRILNNENSYPYFSSSAHFLLRHRRVKTHLTNCFLNVCVLCKEKNSQLEALRKVGADFTPKSVESLTCRSASWHPSYCLLPDLPSIIPLLPVNKSIVTQSTAGILKSNSNLGNRIIMLLSVYEYMVEPHVSAKTLERHRCDHMCLYIYDPNYDEERLHIDNRRVLEKRD